MAEDGVNFIEHEVRTPLLESRKYYAATFDNAPQPTTDEEGKLVLFPPFATKNFPAPVHLREQTVVQELSDDGGSEEEEGNSFRKFKKRRVYHSRKDSQWLLTDKRRKRVLEGEIEGQTARYFMLVPPQPNGADSSFRIVPVHQWLKFKKPLNFKPLSASEAKKMQEENSTMSKIANFMEQKRRKLEESAEAEEPEPSKQRGKAGKRKAAPGNSADMDEEFDFENTEDLLLSEDDMDTKAKARKSNMETLEEDEVAEQDDEENIEVMAIDRKGGPRGEDNGDADFQENFDDDDDDAGVLEEEEQANNDEEDLIQGAEEVRDAMSSEEDEESDGDEDDEDDEEDQEELEAMLERKKRQTEDDDDEEDELERQRYLHNKGRTKVIKEGEGGGAGAAEVAEEVKPVPRAPESLSPYAAFRGKVLDLVRQNGGTMDVKKLHRVVTKKKKWSNMTGEEVESNLLKVLKECFDVERDKITLSELVRIKQQYV